MLTRKQKGKSNVSKIEEIIKGSSKFDAAQLYQAAITSLSRNGNAPSKAFADFVNRLRLSSQVRALIGVDHIHNKAMAYLEARAAELISAQAEGGGVHRGDDSRSSVGPAVKPVNVKKHKRALPGHARIGLAEAQVRAFDQCMGVLLDLYAQCDGNPIVRDVLPENVAKEHVALAREYAALIARKVEMSARAFVEMKKQQKQIEHAA
jgi:hypothetical protein